MRSHTPMHSLVLGMKHLEKGVDPSGIPVDEVLLAATSDERILEVLWQNVRLTFKMCPECRMIRKAMNEAQILDLATELCKKNTQASTWCHVVGLLSNVCAIELIFKSKTRLHFYEWQSFSGTGTKHLLGNTGNRKRTFP